MSRPTTLRASRSTIVLNKVKTFFSKPHNVILLLLGIVLTFTTVAPIVAIAPWRAKRWRPAACACAMRGPTSRQASPARASSTPATRNISVG